MNNHRPLQLLLYAGAAYFCAIAIAHTLGFKVPGLFIYYNVPSHGYQDGIIAFLSFGWAAFFYSCAVGVMESLRQIRALLAACVMALIGLASINLFSDLGNIDTAPFWWQWGLLLVYVGMLIVAYIKTKNVGAISEA